LKATNYTQAQIEQFIIDAGSDSLAVFGGAYEGGIHIQQVPDELAPCIKKIMDSGEEIGAMLEIGSAAGGTCFIMQYFLRPGSIQIIDDNNHPKAWLRPGILRNIAFDEIIGSSRDPEVIRQAVFDIDLLIIDGDHSYEGVKADIDNYLPMLRKGGFLVLHDTIFDDWGVGKMVAELKEGTKVMFIEEYVSDGPHKCGLALFRKVSE